MTKKYAVLTSGYPSFDQPNRMGFVHSRVRAYKELGHNVDVFLVGENYHYNFEGISVTSGSIGKIKSILNNNNYNSIMIHFLTKDKIDIVGNKRCTIWVHGFEALSWKRRLFNINPRLPLYIIDNTIQLRHFKNYAKTHPHSKFIFVSDWMYNVTCEDIGYKIKNYEIIHNYIDSNIFDFKAKTINDRKKILLIRSFENRKYANDISVEFIKELSKKDYFHELDITIYGRGKLFQRLTRKISNIENVNINNTFLTQTAVSDIHKDYGVFLCPTRQDSQGVSMCEAMSSGLVPLTSYNTAIPEFVRDKSEGLLCNNNNIESFVESYEIILNNPNYFLDLSFSASKGIQNQCSLENTIIKELEAADELGS